MAAVSPLSTGRFPGGERRRSIARGGGLSHAIDGRPLSSSVRHWPGGDSAVVGTGCQPSSVEAYATAVTLLPPVRMVCAGRPVLESQMRTAPSALPVATLLRTDGLKASAPTGTVLWIGRTSFPVLESRFALCRRPRRWQACFGSTDRRRAQLSGGSGPVKVLPGGRCCCPRWPPCRPDGRRPACSGSLGRTRAH